MNRPVYIFDGWRFDTGRRILTDPQGKQVKLTCSQFDVLTVLCERPQQPIYRKDFMAVATASYRSIDVRMNRIRHKLDRGGNSMIQNIRHIGYYFTAPVKTE